MKIALPQIATALAGAVVCVATSSIVAVGCSGGGDNTGGPAEGGGQDGTVDANENGDALAGEDSTVDATATGDGPKSGDAGGADGSSDASQASDVKYDVPSLLDFPNGVNEAYCQRLAQCCLLQPNEFNLSGDGGCVPTLDTYSGAYGVGAFKSALDSGLVVYSPAAAANCLQEVSALNCGVVTAATVAKIQTDCLSAMLGTIAIDAGPCGSTLECKAGAFCAIPPDSGTGVCAPLAGAGQPCIDTAASTDCSYLGNGSPALYCAPGDGGARCASDLPLDAGCTANVQCQSGACKYPVCFDSIVYSDPGVPKGTCAYWTIQDAGGG
jgi:hypothetical protein